MKASWKKSSSDDGKWIVRVVADEPFEELPAAGATIDVKKKNGETKPVTLGSQIWSGEGDGRYEDDKGKPIALYALD